MSSFLELSYELQITMVSGYLAYKVYITGRDVEHKTEDVILQVFCLGAIGRIFVLSCGLLFNWRLDTEPSQIGWKFALVAAGTVVASTLLAIVWRLKGNKLFSRLMHRLGVYRDDHEHTAWATITAAPAAWTYIQVHLIDGRTLESDFKLLPKKPPAGRITINKDGIALYITTIHSSEGEEKAQQIGDDQSGLTITYVPRNQISQIDIGWKSTSTIS